MIWYRESDNWRAAVVTEALGNKEIVLVFCDDVDAEEFKFFMHLLGDSKKSPAIWAEVNNLATPVYIVPRD